LPVRFFSEITKQPQIELASRRGHNRAQARVPVLLYSHMTYYERNLPHWHPAGCAIFITWRLAGTLPETLLGKLRNSPEPANRKFALVDCELDRAAYGPRWLAETEIANAVQQSILKGAMELQHYELLAYVIMPNHVHLLVDPRMPIERITRGIKGTTGHVANSVLGRKGLRFWQDESFDHWIRKPAEGEKIIRHIENNPVKARLVTNAGDWRWASASAPVAQALLPVRGSKAKET